MLQADQMITYNMAPCIEKNLFFESQRWNHQRLEVIGSVVVDLWWVSRGLCCILHLIGGFAKVDSNFPETRCVCVLDCAAVWI